MGRREKTKFPLSLFYTVLIIEIGAADGMQTEQTKRCVQMKKRYFNLLAVPALAVIVFCLFSGFSSQDPQDAAKSLIDQRTVILQSFSRGELPYAEAEKQLRRIEDETILEEDLSDLSDKGFSDASVTCSVGFKTMVKKKQFFQYITYEAEIVWDTKSSASEALYNVVVREDSGGYKLTVFEPSKL